MRGVSLAFAVEDYPLAPQTLYKVGGPAKIALFPRNEEEVLEAYAWLATRSEPKLVLGGGSNVLIHDAGFPGIVVFTTELENMESLGADRYVVEGGMELDRFVRDVLIANNYEGTGGLTGIPGSVGGAIYMNAGTVNGSICELMESVDVVNESGIERIPMTRELYGYRGQDFCAPGEFILRGHFQLRKAEKDQRAIYDHYIERRRRTQPKGNSCGSVFKNPEGDHAGRLIESCGLKGTRRGGAVISDLHANFILNEGTATYADIRYLIDLARETVREKCGVALQEEVKMFGPG